HRDATLESTSRSREEHRQPDRRSIGPRPGDAVTQVRRDLDPIARAQTHTFPAFQLELRGAFHDEHVLVLLLVVPEVLGRALSPGHDALDARMPSPRELDELLLAPAARDVVEVGQVIPQVAPRDAHGPAPPCG